ncbi:hypothetical protein HNP84_009483 [Thermocatellispora tengchongensis]|uniref:Adhesin domain-containing protein n=1 Tax=Thermocatellispora tengchongensis TaxID=1073253 RepID=A0A840PL93_9ACTN|nr:hypothetical protein [Thermocatellispora tengchongensis]MBB5139719.1 hypothetical protein [Thermocatellispora tengchongensis]
MRRFLATTTALAALSALAATATACAIELEAEEAHAARSFAYSGAELTITSSLGGLRILPGTGDTVKVDRWLRGKAAEPDQSSWSLRDGTLRLTAECAGVLGDCGARYHIRVPPRVRLKVNSHDDGVTLNDLTQDVEVAASGPIRAYGTSGALRLLGDDDVIVGDRLRSARVHARADGGPINLSFAEPPDDVDVRSRDGRVTTTLPRASYAIKARSEEGEERCELDSRRSSRTIVARSTGGDVRVLAR